MQICPPPEELRQKYEEMRRLDEWIAGYEQCLKDFEKKKEEKKEEKKEDPPISPYGPYVPSPFGYPYSPPPLDIHPIKPLEPPPWYAPRRRRCPRCGKIHPPDCGCPGHYRTYR
jgi:hypothetical protein